MEFISDMSISSLLAPTMSLTTLPFLKILRAGMDMTPNSWAVFGEVSTFSLPILILSSILSERESMTGPIIWQGPHQGAQKSTRTGLSDLMTSWSKFWSVNSRDMIVDEN